MKLEPISPERIDEMRGYYDSLIRNGVKKTEAAGDVADVFSTGKTSVYKYCVPKRTKKIEAYAVKENVANPHFEITDRGNGFWKIEEKKFPGAKTFVITGWEIRVKTDWQFVDCLKQIAAQEQAELMLAPVWADDLAFLPAELRASFRILTEDFKFNENLSFKYVPTHALVQSPLAGWRGTFDHSTVIPGLVKELQTEPSPRYAKQNMTTGSIGRLEATLDNYIYHAKSEDAAHRKAFQKRWNIVTNRAGGRRFAIAQNYTVPSALIVHVLDEKTFLTRFVSMIEPGVVYDLDKKYTAGKKKPETYRPAAINCGDTHAFQTDKTEWQATLSMIRELKPKEVILNDFFDGASVNHHEADSAVKFHSAPSIDAEAEVTRRRLAEVCDSAERVVYLGSNHDNFLNKLLDKNERYWRLNGNYATCCDLQSYRLKTGRHPIEKLLGFKDFENLVFVPEKENHFVGRVTNNHGHQGISGKRAGFVAQARVYNCYAQGHTHNPAVYRNAACAGTDQRRDVEYMIGASGVAAANIIEHEDGSLQLITKVKGIWRI